jgi:hypothetical protein
MNTRIRGVFAPKILVPLLVAGAVGVGTIGVMSLLARRGEAAIAMIPSDAAVAVTFDNTPSASQIGLFNEIKAAMQDSGASDLIDKFLNDLDREHGSFKQLRGHVKGSFAVALWPKTSGEPGVMVAVALDDPAGAESIVAGLSDPESIGSMKYYKPKDGGMAVTFFDGYAIVATDPSLAQLAIRTAKGENPSLNSSASFKAARASLPDDASLMYFINGDAIAKADEKTRKGYAALGITETGWSAGSVTLTSEGIQIDSYQPAVAGNGLLGSLAKTAPLGYKSLDRFPAGAVGVMGWSNLGTFAESMLKYFSSMPEGKDVSEGIAKMEKETGTSLENDWIPAFRGETYFAFYPPMDGSKDPGLVLSVDNSNGGSATKFLKMMIDKANAGRFDHSGEHVRFAESASGDLDLYTPSPKPGDDTEARLAISDSQAMLIVGGSLIGKVTSPNQKLLPSEGFKSFATGDPAKFRLQVDLYAVIDMIDKMGELPKDVNLRQILSGRNLTATGTWETDAAKGTVVIPINVPELIRVLGKKAKESDERSIAMR